jgi:uncharacterized repeat protein (TIGR04076 family)
MDNRVWRIAQKHLGYTDEQMVLLRNDPNNADILSKAGLLRNKVLVLKVVEAHGCNSRHRVGDRFYFDGAGNLLTERCPRKICVHALSSAATLIYAASELLYAGVDPNEMRFKRAGCIDVGLECGGWGRVVMELRAEDREGV